MFKRITEEDVSFLKGICGETHVYFKDKTNMGYSREEQVNLLVPPQIVVELRNSQMFTNIMNYAYENNISVTHNSDETGLIGGIVLSMDYENRPIALDEDNLTMWFR